MKPTVLLLAALLCGCTKYEIKIDSRPTKPTVENPEPEAVAIPPEPKEKYRIVKRDDGYIAQGYYGSLRWCDIGHTKTDVESICRDIRMLKSFDAEKDSYVPPYAKPQDEANVVNCNP